MSRGTYSMEIGSECPIERLGLHNWSTRNNRMMGLAATAPVTRLIECSIEASRDGHKHHNSSRMQLTSITSQVHVRSMTFILIFMLAIMSPLVNSITFSKYTRRITMLPVKSKRTPSRTSRYTQWIPSDGHPTSSCVLRDEPRL